MQNGEFNSYESSKMHATIFNSIEKRIAQEVYVEKVQGLFNKVDQLDRPIKGLSVCIDTGWSRGNEFVRAICVVGSALVYTSNTSHARVVNANDVREIDRGIMSSTIYVHGVQDIHIPNVGNFHGKSYSGIFEILQKELS